MAPQPPSLTSASLSDILTAIKNLVIATNANADALNSAVPHFTSGQLAASTLVQVGFVRVTGISVTTAGAAGTLNDAATIAGAGAGNVISSVPATVGFFPVNMVFMNGLVYLVGAAQVVTLFYSRT